ncbi:MAG: hypothetical protein ABFD60_07800 [Bryobacteraceae bacterium]
MASYSDDFERAALGGNWTVGAGTPQIYSSSDFGGGGAGVNYATYTAGTLATQNQYAEMVFSVVADTPQGGALWLRLDGSSNGYEAKFSSDYVEIFRLDAGVPTSIGTDNTVTIAASDVCRFECNGSTIRTLINGVENLSITDANHTAGRSTGLSTSNTTARIESWAAADLSTATFTQEGYRWRNDDGDEANATWTAAQDTGITAPANAVRRIRFIVDTAGDTNAALYQLEYKEANDANWTKVT